MISVGVSDLYQPIELKTCLRVPFRTRRDLFSVFLIMDDESLCHLHCFEG